MSTDKTGGPAFPIPVEDDMKCTGRADSVYGGMTLLDYFAAKAMQGFVASTGIVGGISPSDEDLARYSYDMALAMLEAREGVMR